MHGTVSKQAYLEGSMYLSSTHLMEVLFGVEGFEAFGAEGHQGRRGRVANPGIQFRTLCSQAEIHRKQKESAVKPCILLRNRRCVLGTSRHWLIPSDTEQQCTWSPGSAR